MKSTHHPAGHLYRRRRRNHHHRRRRRGCRTHPANLYFVKYAQVPPEPPPPRRYPHCRPRHHPQQRISSGFRRSRRSGWPKLDRPDCCNFPWLQAGRVVPIRAYHCLPSQPRPLPPIAPLRPTWDSTLALPGWLGESFQLVQWHHEDTPLEDCACGPAPFPPAPSTGSEQDGPPPPPESARTTCSARTCHAWGNAGSTSGPAATDQLVVIEGQARAVAHRHHNAGAARRSGIAATHEETIQRVRVLILAALSAGCPPAGASSVERYLRSTSPANTQRA